MHPIIWLSLIGLVSSAVVLAVRPDLAPAWRDLDNPPLINEYLRRQAMSVHDYRAFLDDLKKKPEDVRPKLLASGLKYYGELRLKPGRYRLRTLIRNGETGQMGLSVSSLLVPAFAQTSAPTSAAPACRC